MMIEISLAKGNELHRIRYAPGEECAVLDALVAMANNPGLRFDWYDAAVLAHQIGMSIADGLKSPANPPPDCQKP